MKNVIILGSTGQLGTAVLKILEKYPQEFTLLGISANQNKSLFQSQISQYQPSLTTLSSEDGEASLLELATHPDAHIIINVLSGTAGIAPSLAALRANKTLLLANKESVVAEGKKLINLATSGQIIPIDSEHNAIYEILRNHPDKTINEILLPCSGGPFLGKTTADLQKTTTQEALAHPTWQMGAKISIESATLINKGLEIIEAHHLFKIPLEKIKVLIHPECQVHAIVKFTDGQELAYLSEPNMYHHIENALLASINQPGKNYQIRPLKPQEFNFQTPDHKTFPGIHLTLNAFQRHPQNMKNFLQKEEEAIADFLQQKIKFLDIYKKITLY